MGVLYSVTSFGENTDTVVAARTVFGLYNIDRFRIKMKTVLPIQPSVTWIIAVLVLLGIFPLYSLPSSGLPVLWFSFLIFDTILIFFLADFFLDSSISTILVCLWLFVFQNMFIGLFNSPRADTGIIPWLYGYTILIPAIMMAFAFLRRGFFRFRNLSTLDIVSILYFSYMCFHLFFSPWPLQARIAAFRNTIAFVMLFYVGYLRPNLHREDLLALRHFIAILIFLVLIFGYIEFFVLGDRFWVERVNIDLIMQSKNLRASSQSIYGVPSDFYSPISGIYYRRMASLFASPITLAYFLSFSLMFAFYYSKAIQSVIFRIALHLSILVALLLTFSKGGTQIAVTSLFVYFWIKILPPRRFRTIVGSVIVLACIFALAVYEVSQIIGSTVILHFEGLYTPFLQADGISALLGHSLGSGGAISSLLDESVLFDVSRGAESGIGSLFYQTGFLGITFFLAMMVILLRRLFYTYQSCLHSDPDLSEFLLVTFAANTGLLVNVFFQENALSPIPVSLFAICAGVGINLALVTKHRRIAVEMA